MNICVLGLWHLGTVTAAALASLGHRVVGLDFDELGVAKLNRGLAPVFEPGLEELLLRGLSSGNLRFSSALKDANHSDVLWVAYDTPVDDEDNADADFVTARIERVLLESGTDATVLVTSQLPVGSVGRLEQSLAAGPARMRPKIAYSPENLRLGRAVADFLHPDRIVVGVRSERDKTFLHGLLSPLTESIEWMSVESAEMTKHAVNAFFAASVVFANEIASICEQVGADAKEVERGLKTETRIGPRAYLAPGAAFAGGTLARDVKFLERMGRDRDVFTPLLSSLRASNHRHGQWAQRKLRALYGDLSHTTVAVWGLTYKPNTDTLRRSLAVELCDWLIQAGAKIQVHDPAAGELPERWHGRVRRFDAPTDAVRGAQALVVATEWPIYRTFSASELLECAAPLAVLDANRFASSLSTDAENLSYFTVGMPVKDTKAR
jgi:UDPglucose 6-dehydrogenase